MSELFDICLLDGGRVHPIVTLATVEEKVVEVARLANELFVIAQFLRNSIHIVHELARD